ncbi:MAG: helix-turn-helix domain-containing protein [Myxococcota bacterium]
MRREKGWSQDEFACDAKIDGRQVSRYENGRVMPSIEVVIKMAKAYNVSLDYLLLDDAPRRPLEVHASRLAERVMCLESLTEEDERALLHILDSLEAKTKLKELAAGVG